MPEIQFSLPPGVYRNGTERQSAGRWYDANLVRWYEGATRPVYGWVQHSPSQVTGSARGLITWRDNTANAWIGIGTHSHLYAMTQGGALYDITPAGYTVGNANASLAGGFGFGAFGSGTFGTPRLNTGQIQDATVWTLDTWGQDLVGMCATDGFAYEWALDTATPAAKIANAPTGRALVVTAERIMMILGTTDPRTVSWSDQQNDTLWAPDATNQAGSFPLQTAGRLMCGKRLTGVTGLWTDLDMWVATYIGGELIYSFTKAASGCGAISQQAVAATDSQAAWMGQNGFWTYNGYVSPLACDVNDYVFSNINRTQVSEIYAVLVSDFGEVWWFYPSGQSIEVDSYVVWNYRENHWSIGKLARTAGTDRGAFIYPLMVGADGFVYEHENGFSYDGAAPYAETGPLEFAPLAETYTAMGAKTWQATRFVPDELQSGDVSATFKSRFFANGPETVSGPYTLSPKTDVRFSGRQVKLRVTGASPDDWRFGNATLTINGAGDR